MKTYKITFLDHLNSLKYGLIVSGFFLVVFSIPLAVDDKKTTTELVIGILLFMAVVYMSPLILIHINYYFANRKTTLSIDGEVFHYFDGKTELTFEKKYISLIERHQCQENTGGYRSYRSMTAWSNYSYVKIKILDDQVIYLSSLLISEEDFPLYIADSSIHFLPLISKEII